MIRDKLDIKIVIVCKSHTIKILLPNMQPSHLFYKRPEAFRPRFTTGLA